MRERKSNAQKQFAYNKLKNEKQVIMKHENRKSLTAPKRPPQPKLVNFEKKEKDGMLIDLTSPQQQDIPTLMPNGSVFDSAFASKLNDMSILDAPIDVPTEGYPDEELNAVGFFDSESSNTKPEPPPYAAPPTYMNTFVMNNYGNLDPFDTSHIASTQSQPSTMATTAAASSSSHFYSAEDNSSKFIRNQIQTTSCKELGYISRPRPTAKSDIDEMIQNKMASLSPKINHKQIPSATTATNDVLSSDPNRQATQSTNDSSFKVSDNSALNDSLQVNLSSLTLNDSDEFASHTMPSTSAEQNPKLDRAFLAELEKEIYKNDNAAINLNVNNAQANEFGTLNAKDNTVSAISHSTNWLKNDVTAKVYQQKNAVAAAMQSPSKYNNDSIKMSNNESATTNLALSKKLYNSEINSADLNAIYASSASNQMGIANNVTMATANSGSNQAIYSNYAMTGNNSVTQHDQKYNFVTSASNNYSVGAATTNINNIYSVASDIYGSAAGVNVYDVVASSSNSEYYQTIQPNDFQSVIYDEVAADMDIRPHRPAPGPPILSAQQIQRRLERAQKEQSHQLYGNLESNYVNNSFSNAAANHSIYEEINQKANTISSCNDVSTKDTLNAANSGTIKNMKIEQLLR